MFTRNVRSGTEDHPAPRDVFSALLSRLTNGKYSQGWAHFEWREHPGWFKNLFRGMPPVVEVALRKGNTLELNLGLPSKVKDPKEHCESKGMPLLDSWSMSGGTCTVPVSDLPNLVDWIETYFVKVHGCPSNFHVNGHLEGL